MNSKHIFYTDIGKDGLVRGRCGTPGYVAPDIFNAGMHEGYPINVDMFSVLDFVPLLYLLLAIEYRSLIKFVCFEYFNL